MSSCVIYFFFFFNDTATTEIYTLSLHDALPIWLLHPDDQEKTHAELAQLVEGHRTLRFESRLRDRKSTRLNSSHTVISYAVFCLKKKIQMNNVLRALIAEVLGAYGVATSSYIHS